MYRLLLRQTQGAINVAGSEVVLYAGSRTIASVVEQPPIEEVSLRSQYSLDIASLCLPNTLAGSIGQE